MLDIQSCGNKAGPSDPSRSRGHPRAAQRGRSPSCSQKQTSHLLLFNPISLSSSATPHFRNSFKFFFFRGAPREHHTGEEHPCADGRACVIPTNVLQRSPSLLNTQTHFDPIQCLCQREPYLGVQSLVSFITTIIPAYKQDRMMKKIFS